MDGYPLQTNLLPQQAFDPLPVRAQHTNLTQQSDVLSRTMSFWIHFNYL